MAGRIGDGYVSVMPDGDAVRQFRTAGGGDKVAQAGFKAACAPTTDEGARIAYQKWPNAGVPGELSQVLPSPKQAHLDMIDKYRQAGFDEIYVAHTGPHFQGLFDLYAEHVLPKL